ncbi:MAG: TlpA family protein disulfide reductase [Bacteroidetes bacterium]|nr:TlpA family protein disulfide reductase [Bacteroidota bacterium]
MKKKAVLLAILGFVLGPIFGQPDYEKAMKDCQKKGMFESHDCMVGEYFPDFEAITIEDEKVNTLDLKGKVVVLNFWFIACAPCIAELNGLNEIVEKYSDSDAVEFISITPDTKQILEEEFFPNYDFKFKIIPNSMSLIYDTLKIWWGYPTTIVIDKEGKIHKVTSGGSTEEETASEEIKLKLIPVIEECLQVVSDQKIKDSIPLHEYKFSREIEEKLAKGEIKLLRAAQFYSYIGEYQKALSVPCEKQLEWGFDTLTKEDKKYFKEFSPFNAVDAIVKRASHEKIVIINEAHHKPLHRVFTKKILKGLYEQGYRYFGLEALSNCSYVPPQFCDSLLNTRGYPLNSPLSGTYVREPQMSNLIREAHEMGFELFAYEKFGQDREFHQAKYIAEITEKNPEAKFLILCGWYHLLESEYSIKWMATHLREMTGINPFTIYQDILIERYCTQESPFMEMMDYDEPKVFINEKGDFYNGSPTNKMFDALVYHPRTKYINNRPDWLANLEGHQFYKIDDIQIEYPCLIKAYKKKESNHSVPIDIIEKDYKQDPTALILPTGVYRIEIENRKGEKEIRGIEVE